ELLADLAGAPPLHAAARHGGVGGPLDGEDVRAARDEHVDRDEPQRGRGENDGIRRAKRRIREAFRGSSDRHGGWSLLTGSGSVQILPALRISPDRIARAVDRAQADRAHCVDVVAERGREHPPALARGGDGKLRDLDPHARVRPGTRSMTWISVKLLYGISIWTARLSPDDARFGTLSTGRAAKVASTLRIGRIARLSNRIRGNGGGRTANESP